MPELDARNSLSKPMEPNDFVGWVIYSVWRTSCFSLLLRSIKGCVEVNRQCNGVGCENIRLISLKQAQVDGILRIFQPFEWRLSSRKTSSEQMRLCYHVLSKKMVGICALVKLGTLFSSHSYKSTSGPFSIFTLYFETCDMMRNLASYEDRPVVQCSTLIMTSSELLCMLI